MDFNDIDLYTFKFHFHEKKRSLSSISKKMITTLFEFVRMKPENKKTRIKKSEINQKLVNLSDKINNMDDEKAIDLLSSKYSELESMILNNEPYFDLLIKLECAVGIYPDEIFLNKARKIFCDEVYIPIMTDTYIDEYITKGKVQVKTRK